jgi:hypothetical protein
LVSAVAPAADGAALAAALGPGPQADIAAVNDRVRRGQMVQLRRVSWAAYDQYLKANRIEEGVRNYNAVLTLLARARFEKGWVPVPLAAPNDAPRSGAS